MEEFDIEKLERKNIYKVPDHLFENIQDRVMQDIKPGKKAPIFKLKLNWMYGAAAALALISGATFVFNSNDDSVKETTHSKELYTVNKGEPKTESEIAYETLKSDLTSVDKNGQSSVIQQDNEDSYIPVSIDRIASISTKKGIKHEEKQVNEILDSFSNSDISELASNSTQDIYLDLYN